MQLQRGEISTIENLSGYILAQSIVITEVRYQKKRQKSIHEFSTSLASLRGLSVETMCLPINHDSTPSRSFAVVVIVVAVVDL